MDRNMVLVTGVTGFVGGYVAEELLTAGYDVRGVARDPGRAQVEHLHEAARRSGTRFDVAPASLTEDAGWDAAVEGVHAVAHVASPAPKARPKDEDEVIRPAVDGTRRVLRAAARVGVRRVAVTSSIDAVRSGHDLRDGRVLDEDTWSIAERSDPYAKSKTLAERTAWELAGELDLELVTLLPGLVLGQVRGRETNVSVDLIRQLMARELPALPRLGFTLVHVRDVATAHRLALEVDAAVGRRFILATEAIWLADIARVLDEEFGPRAHRIPRRELPSWAVRLGARLNPTMRVALPLLDTPAATSSDRARAELGWTSYPARQAIVDAAESLVAAGVVAPARGS
jgi:dihydroflavonol-4-reductase